MAEQDRTQAAPRKELSLFDSTCIIVGIIIGAGIYQMAPDIAKGAGSWWAVFAIWAAGGLLSLFGALGYAELATAYPREGGDYVYLSKAYGKWAGYLFGWSQLAIIRPGDIAVMAFAFATYGRQIYYPFGQDVSERSIAICEQLYAGGAVVVLTLLNIIGVRQSKWTQNILTVAKAVGLLAIAGVAVAAMGGSRPATQPTEVPPFPLMLAMVFVLFTFGGWNEMAYVAAEVKNPRRNIVRALVLGAAVVTVLYLLVNAAFMSVLGFSGMANSQAVATETVSAVFPRAGATFISVLVCISALGAVNGLVFTGARISYALGAEHRTFGVLGRWSGRTATPVPALIAQGLIALTLIVVLRGFVETVMYTAVAVYTFYLGTSLAVIVLRFKEPQVERPYKVTGYPITTLVFCAVCAYLIYSCATYAWNVKRTGLFVCVGIVLAGLVLYWVTDVRGKAGGKRGERHTAE